MLDETPQRTKGTDGADVRRAQPTPARTTPSHDSLDSGRFPPGTTLAGRYRIVSLLGRGGMGEVYRADDLKLEQPVALKFLPETLSTDGAALARFHREVRIARQISHRNVCRVYDIGETEGQHFLSMEYIKGEELASLLRRIGRLPADKGLEVARQLCAGLTAAHEGGVLHRDLKPANVMIDERGNVRVTDFGLAGLADELREPHTIAGTPAYMAPEQLAGREVTARSDIYALGLVLYEIFTGRRAYDARTFDELLKLHASDMTPTSPSSLIKDIDPLVERVIARCLEKEPEKRPASALQVAAALPGGDPIAAALAAGETPSPEMVAAAPKEGALKPAVAVALLASFVGVLALCCWLTKYTAVHRLSPLDEPPEALRARARDVIKKLGYTEQPFDSADGVILKEDYLRYIAAHDSSPTRWDRLRNEGPGAYRFWYRQSPRYFDTFEDIAVDKPALDVSGMTSVYLDMAGRLHWFVGVPPQREPPGQEHPAPDWSLAFREAGLDMTNFQPVASMSVPLHAYDTRAAWDGADPTHPELKTHVEAAAFRGKLIYFETIYPWDQPVRQEQQPESGGNRALTLIIIIVCLTSLIGSALLARRNLRLGRGDRRGAARVASFYAAVRMLVWLFEEHHNGLPGREFNLFLIHLALAVFSGIFLWLLYVALEPFVRRRWPERIISWSRLLAGAYGDPLVGRDILIGAVFGVGMMLSIGLAFVGLRWIGRPSGLTLNPGNTIIGAHHFTARFTSQLSAGLFTALISLFLLLLFVVVLRRERLALGALWLLLTLLTTLVTQANVLMTPFTALAALLGVFVLYRYGLLAMVSALFFLHLWVFYPLTTELTAWYATDFIIALAICVALAAYGCYVSLAGQSLFGRSLLED
jgi:serine/threonine-protein kinase